MTQERKLTDGEQFTLANALYTAASRFRSLAVEAELLDRYLLGPSLKDQFERQAQEAEAFAATFEQADAVFIQTKETP